MALLPTVTHPRDTPHHFFQNGGTQLAAENLPKFFDFKNRPPPIKLKVGFSKKFSRNFRHEKMKHQTLIFLNIKN